MENPGERLVGDYLRYIKNCDFVDFNVYTTETQGEIDVFGYATATRRAYICEVVTHLGGIQYVNVKIARPDTAGRLIRKFIKDIDYGRRAFPKLDVEYMLWSPVVRRSRQGVQYDQFEHLRQIEDEVRARTGVSLMLVINEAYARAIDELRTFARKETKELKSPIMRFLQIEEWCRKNVDRIVKTDKRAASLSTRSLST
jgi:hypothetical protein